MQLQQLSRKLLSSLYITRNSRKTSYMSAALPFIRSRAAMTAINMIRKPLWTG